jgi:hypothetical protein
MCTTFAVVTFALPGANAPVARPPETTGDASWPARQLDVGGAPSSDEVRLNAERRPVLDGIDEIAVLEALHLALTGVPDGATYIWHRRGGGIRGTVRLTTSFRDAGDRVCRHLIVLLVAGHSAGRAEGIACREADHAWTLGG